MDSRLIFLHCYKFVFTDGVTKYDRSGPIRIWVPKAKQFI